MIHWIQLVLGQTLSDLEWLLGALADDGDHALGRALLLAAVFPGYQGSFGRMLARRGSQPMWRLYPTGGMMQSEDKDHRQRNHRPSYQHENPVEEHRDIMTQIRGFEYAVPE